MSLEALVSNKFPSFLIYDTILATPQRYSDTLTKPLPFKNSTGNSMSWARLTRDYEFHSSPMLGNFLVPESVIGTPPPPLSLSMQGRKKRRPRQRSCKNKEEAENQRMMHIAVERNRRRQMNEHLTMLRSLIPESYIQRGDQASIVGAAIDFIKELEQLLQSLEAKKRRLQQKLGKGEDPGPQSSNSDPPFAQFFRCPQYIWCHSPMEYSCNSNWPVTIADIEVTLIETHANIRILSAKKPGQLMEMMAGFQSLQLTILHINVTALDPLVLYSLSAKVEEGCKLTSVDDIAAAVHHMLTLIEAEAAMS